MVFVNQLPTTLPVEYLNKTVYYYAVTVCNRSIDMGELERRAHAANAAKAQQSAASLEYQAAADRERRRQQEESYRRGAEFIALALRRGVPRATVYAKEVVTKRGPTLDLHLRPTVTHDVVGSVVLGRGWALRETGYDSDVDGTAWGVILTENNQAFYGDGVIKTDPPAGHGLPPGPCLPIDAMCKRGGTVEDRVLSTVFAGESGMNILLHAMDRYDIRV
jgi:hypothetical protein